MNKKGLKYNNTMEIKKKLIEKIKEAIKKGKHYYHEIYLYINKNAPHLINKSGENNIRERMQYYAWNQTTNKPYKHNNKNAEYIFITKKTGRMTYIDLYEEQDIKSLNKELIEYDEAIKNKINKTSPMSTEVPIRSSNVVKKVLDRAKGVCECCGKHKDVDNKDNNSVPELQVHHIQPLCYAKDKNGHFDNDKLNQLDKESNCIAVCPNCHRRIHLSKNPIKLHDRTTYKSPNGKKSVPGLKGNSDE